MARIVGQDNSMAKRITCKNCGGVNEYMPGDVRILAQGRDISQCMCTTKGFNCAQCGQPVTTYAD